MMSSNHLELLKEDKLKLKLFKGLNAVVVVVFAKGLNAVVVVAIFIGEMHIPTRESNRPSSELFDA